MLDFFAAMFLLASFIVRHCAWIFGVGAILLEFQGARRYRLTPAAPAAPAGGGPAMSPPAGLRAETAVTPPPDPFGPSEPPR